MSSYWNSFFIFLGPRFGLSLLINIEQYEHIAGFAEDVGAKVLLHDQEEIPLVRDLGTVIPTGMHSVLTIRHDVVSSHTHLTQD